MRLFGLIGYPLTHSFSKKYFTEKFEREGLKGCSYQNFPCETINDLLIVLDDYPELAGLNVTIPYKESVIDFLTDKDEIVEKISACNCIKIENKKLIGFNTDVVGFEKSLVKKLRKEDDSALVLGTGGAAKAVEFVLKKLNIACKFVSRNPLPGQMPYQEVSNSVIEKNKLIINTTPVGMYPNMEQAPPISYEAISPDHFLFDLIYNPEKTIFLKKGEEKGARIQNGYEMLALQAEESWKIWNT